MRGLLLRVDLGGLNESPHPSQRLEHVEAGRVLAPQGGDHLQRLEAGAFVEAARRGLVDVWVIRPERLDSEPPHAIRRQPFGGRINHRAPATAAMMLAQHAHDVDLGGNRRVALDADEPNSGAGRIACDHGRQVVGGRDVILPCIRPPEPFGQCFQDGARDKRLATGKVFDGARGHDGRSIMPYLLPALAARHHSRTAASCTAAN